MKVAGHGLAPRDGIALDPDRKHFVHELGVVGHAAQASASTA
jgi:hypothetical protein